MKIKKILASLLSVTVIGISMPVLSSFSETSVTASADEIYGDFQITKFNDHVEISKYTGKSAEVEIPSKIDGLPVTSIGDKAFISCYSIESVIIPDSVTSICHEAFSNCRNLTSINIPDSVTDIGSFAFVSCTELESIIIPDSVTNIGSCAFWFCTNLSSITIPDSVTNIGERAFKDTPWLENKQKEDVLVIVNNLLIDGTACSGDVFIPDSVTSIGDYSFHNCKNLTSVTISDSVVYIGERAFANCPSLTSITIPNSVKNIENGAFALCESLKSIVIPDSVTYIEYSTFSECTNLVSITILNPNCEIYDSSGTICNKSEYDSELKKYVDKYSGIIKGYSGSTAEAYAKKYGYTFKSTAPDFLLGDVTLDGIINGSDATCALRAYTLISSGMDHGLTDMQFKAADVDSDGIITGSDATLLLRYYTALSSLLKGETLPPMEEWITNR